MTTVGEQLTKKRKRVRPVIYATCKRLICPHTGEIIPAFVPARAVDTVICRDRKIRVGDRVRMEISKPRNEKFHRLVHGLGTIVVEQIEGFEKLDAHSAIKRLQREAAVFCEEVTAQLAGFGSITLLQPLSIAFDAMDESDFSLLFSGICKHLIATYWPGMTQDQIERQAEMIGGA